MTRATPLPPDERRAAIIAATRPLVLAHGADISTKQIAEACGLAEGTLFRAFPNKDAILHACVDDMLAPGPLVAAIARIDRSLPLEGQLAEAVDLLLESGRQIVGVFAVLHPKRGPGERPVEPKHPAHEDDKQAWSERRSAPIEALTRLIEPHAAALRTDVPTAVAFVRGLVFSATFPLTADERLDAPTLTDLICRALIKET